VQRLSRLPFPNLLPLRTTASRAEAVSVLAMTCSLMCGNRRKDTKDDFERYMHTRGNEESVKLLLALHMSDIEIQTIQIDTPIK